MCEYKHIHNHKHKPKKKQKKNKKTSKQNNTKQKNYKSGIINQVIKTINQVFLQSFSKLLRHDRFVNTYGFS